MDDLQVVVGSDWERQVQAVRDAVTDDTNLIRFDNGFYRICRDTDAPFTLRVANGHSSAALRLTVRSSDLYVTHIQGQPFETYNLMLDTKSQSTGGALAAAVDALAKGPDPKRFMAQSLLVLCVAESLRNDHVATDIGQWLRVSTGLIGISRELPVKGLLDEAHAWGRTSDAVLAATGDVARKATLKAQARREGQERKAWERVNLELVPSALQAYANRVKVLKRPR